MVVTKSRRGHSSTYNPSNTHEAIPRQIQGPTHLIIGQFSIIASPSIRFSFAYTLIDTGTLYNEEQ